MASNFIDLNAPAHNGSLPTNPAELPHGLVPPPPEVLEWVAQEEARFPFPWADEARKRITEDWTLQYYYEGRDVAYRRTEKGLEVLAVGLDEIAELIKCQKVSPGEQYDFVIEQA
jgi:hypothetical protein